MRINGNIMRSQYNTQAIKKATNLTLNSDLLAEAKRLKINLSATMEKALSQEVSKLKRQEWLEQNSEAIDACNELTDKHGLFSDSYRVF
jgi:antitoxin CcdA